MIEALQTAAAALAVVTLLYYLLVYEQPVEGHWPAHYVSQATPNGPNWNNTWTVFANAIFSEFIPFIVLLFSLYTISGGIRIEGDLRATPLVNAIIIFVGSVLASFVGTTGAAMLLIRLLLDTNSERKHVAHTVIFFIFAVCNCGGCLLPIGDPPLFLGYLRGVPFLWTFQLWKEWAFVNITLIVLYFLWDTFWFYPREEKRDLRRDVAEVRRLSVKGLWPNLPLLIGVVLGVPVSPVLFRLWFRRPALSRSFAVGRSPMLPGHKVAAIHVSWFERGRTRTLCRAYCTTTVVPHRPVAVCGLVAE